LHTIAESYPSLAEFLADLALAPPDGSAVGVEPAGRDDEQVVLSTIHSAKGLEWQCVFLLWVVDGKFPSVFAFNTDEELDEERRLLYVAVTRAKRYLFLTYPINVSLFRSRPVCLKRWLWSKRAMGTSGGTSMTGTSRSIVPTV